MGKQWKEQVPGLTDEEALVVDKTVEELKKLSKEYGAENLTEILKICGVNGKKILKRKNILMAIEELVIKIQKINSNDFYKTFKSDPAHNNKTTPNSIQEATAGIACIEQGLLKDLIRSPRGAEEFIDTKTGIPWDVKTARSNSLDGDRIFDIVEFIDSLKKAYREQENIILQITDLSEEDAKILIRELTQIFNEKEMTKTLVVHADDHTRSIATEDLLKVLREQCR